MFKYLLKRVLIFIPTLLIISLVIFGLSKIVPGDPVELKLAGGLGAGTGGQAADKLADERQYFEVAKELGLDIPTFYFALTPSTVPDTLYRVARRYERETLRDLAYNYGNWPEVSKYFNQLKALEFQTFSQPKNEFTSERLRTIREISNELYREKDEAVIKTKLANIKKLTEEVSVIEPDTTLVQAEQVQQSVTYLKDMVPSVEGLISQFETVGSNSVWWKKYVPAFHWYGIKNQYHRWIFGDTPWFRENTDPTKSSRGILRGDFGKSYQDDRPVLSTLAEGIKITMGLNAIALFLIYLLSIPLGVYLAVNRGKAFDRIATLILFVLYALPGFWIMTLMIVFFTNPTYGMDWFPGFGIGEIKEGMNWFDIFRVRAYHFILPIIAMVYGGLAFLAKQMRGSFIDVMNKDFIRTAKSKGLSENTIVWKHIFRNSLLPLITMFASLFPRMIGGSVVLEIIFAIPGMGRIGFNSIFAKDWPILFAVLMLSAVLTLVGILVSDILYTVADPRITFNRKN